METVKITETMMNSIHSRAIGGGDAVHRDKKSGLITVEYNNQACWFSANGLSNKYFKYDAVWKCVDDGEDKGEWVYSVKVGDSVEYFTDEA